MEPHAVTGLQAMLLGETYGQSLSGRIVNRVRGERENVGHKIYRALDGPGNNFFNLLRDKSLAPRPTAIGRIYHLIVRYLQFLYGSEVFCSDTGLEVPLDSAVRVSDETFGGCNIFVAVDSN